MEGGEKEQRAKSPLPPAPSQVLLGVGRGLFGGVQNYAARAIAAVGNVTTDQTPRNDDDDEPFRLYRRPDDDA